MATIGRNHAVVELKKLRFGGYLQGSGYYTDIKNAESEYGFDIDHAYLSLEGSFLNEKLGFFLQADFADSYPLLDAWVSYAPWKQLKISAGQKQTFTNDPANDDARSGTCFR